MTNPTSMIDVFNMFLEHSRDPFLNSMQGLPANVLDRLMADMVKNAEINCQDGSLSIIVDMKAFKNRVKAAFTSEIVEDEVGVLIQFGASKNVISELTGVHHQSEKSWIRSCQGKVDLLNWMPVIVNLLSMHGDVSKVIEWSGW